MVAPMRAFRFLCCPSLVLAFLAAACSPAPADGPASALPAGPTFAPRAGVDTADTGGEASWGEVVGRRFIAEEVAFYPASGGFRAVQAAQGLEVVVGTGGAHLRLGEHTIRLRVASFGHADSPMEPRFAAAALGDCVASGDVDMEETCISRV